MGIEIIYQRATCTTPGARCVEWNARFTTASGAIHYSATGYRLTEQMPVDDEGNTIADYTPAARARLATATTAQDYRDAIALDAERALQEFEAREVAEAAARAAAMDL